MGAPSKWPWDVIRMAVAGGVMTMRQASAKWVVPFGTVSARSSREGWFKKDSAKLAEVAPQLAESIADQRRVDGNSPENRDIALATLPELRERIRKAGGQISAKALEHVAKQTPEYALGKAKAVKDLVDAGGKATGFGEEAAGNTVVTFNFLKDLPEGGPIVDIPGRPELPADEDTAEHEAGDSTDEGATGDGQGD